MKIVLAVMIMAGVALASVIAGCKKEEKDGLPTLTTRSVTDISYTSAKSGGNITKDGGADIILKGLVWSIQNNPTLEQNTGMISQGSGLGSFAGDLTELNPDITYYVRAYATNSKGTAYGNQQSFTTLRVPIPVISTTAVSNTTAASAESGGTVSDDGGSAVTARGVCWSTSPEPTINDLKTNDGSGLGSFTSNLTSLTPNTTYFVRAYATNSYGVAYGNQVEFVSGVNGQPCPSTPHVYDIDGNFYYTVLIGSQCWMKVNLKTTLYRNGTPVGYVGSTNDWINNTSGAYVWYGRDINWKGAYGALYNWYAANNTNGLCPTGWHVPSFDDWEQLINYVVAQGFPNEPNNPNGAGSALKSCRQENSPMGGNCNTSQHPFWWEWPANHGFDEFGFSGVPGGSRVFLTHREFYFMNFSAVYWASTEASSSAAYMLELKLSSNVILFPNRKYYGYSVRCIRD